MSYDTKINSSHSVLRTRTLTAPWHVNHMTGVLEFGERNSPNPVTSVTEESCGLGGRVRCILGWVVPDSGFRVLSVFPSIYSFNERLLTIL